MVSPVLILVELVKDVAIYEPFTMFEQCFFRAHFDIEIIHYDYNCSHRKHSLEWRLLSPGFAKHKSTVLQVWEKSSSDSLHLGSECLTDIAVVIAQAGEVSNLDTDVEEQTQFLETNQKPFSVARDRSQSSVSIYDAVDISVLRKFLKLLAHKCLS